MGDGHIDDRAHLRQGRIAVYEGDELLRLLNKCGARALKWAWYIPATR